MTAYFDTSALVPLVIDEPGSKICERAWGAATTIVSSSLAYVEAHTALAQAERIERISATQRRQAATAFDGLWRNVTAVTPSKAIIQNAATLGIERGLRGYDAVHCATAIAAFSAELYAVSGDRSLLAAWHALGIATVDTNQ